MSLCLKNFSVAIFNYVAKTKSADFDILKLSLSVASQNVEHIIGEPSLQSEEADILKMSR